MFEKNNKKKNHDIISKMLGPTQENKNQKIKLESFLGIKKQGQNDKILDFNKSKKVDISKYLMGQQKTSHDIRNDLSSSVGVPSYKNKQIDMSKLIGNTEGKAKQHMIKNPEQIGINRINQQFGLSMFGDYDKDKVPNVLDCHPRNKLLQGAVHRVPGQEFKPAITQITPTTPTSRRKVTEIGYKTESEIEPQQILLEEQLIKPKYAKPTVDNIIQQKITKPKLPGFEFKSQEKIEKHYLVDEQQPTQIKYITDEDDIITQPTVGEKAKKLFTDVWEDSGLHKKLESRREEKEFVAGIRKEARGEAIKELEKQKVRDIYAQELAKVTPTRKPSWSERITGAGEGFRQSARDISTGIGLKTTPEQFASKTRALVGYTYDVPAAAALIPPTREPFTYKIGAALGEEPTYIPPVQPTIPVGVQTYRPATIQPTVAPQVQPMVASAVVPVEETVYSPYSKKKVTYTRGPYKKRPTVQATQVVQPVQQQIQYQ